jgi:hypothetical protein
VPRYVVSYHLGEIGDYSIPVEANSPEGAAVVAREHLDRWMEEELLRLYREGDQRFEDRVAIDRWKQQQSFQPVSVVEA